MSLPPPDPRGESLPQDRERLLEDIAAVLEAGPLDVDRIKRRIRDVPPEDIAGVLLELEPREKLALFRALSDEAAARVLDEADEDSTLELLDAIGEDALARVMEEMPPDEGADLLAVLDPERRHRVLRKLDPEHAQNMRELEQFDPATAGGLMTNDFLMVTPRRPVREVLQELRDAELWEELPYVYVVDELRNLLGVVSVADLLQADPEAPVSSVMEKASIRVPPDMDREEVARIVDRYHLKGVPVTDDRGALLGVVTLDDVMDVLEEEVSEDMYHLAGTAPHNPFVESVWRRVWLRLPWLTVTMLGGFASVAIIKLFEDAIDARASIAFFIPIIGALAGNVGVQSSTIMVRGFATGDIPQTGRIVASLLLNEVMIGLIIGIICGLCTGVYAAAVEPADAARFGISVGLSIFGAIAAAAAVGSMVPLVCSRIGVDPALAAGPFIVTVIDLCAHLIYFVVLTVILLGTL